MEAWFRQDAGLQAEDLIQRMPYTLKDNVYPGRKIINRLVRRRELFRNFGRCLSWTKETYGKMWDLHLLNETEANKDPANPNSTRHLQDLTTEEINAFKDAIYLTGKNLTKARGRELGGEKKEQKRRKIEDRKADRPDLVSKLASVTNKDGSARAKKTQVRKRNKESTKGGSGRKTNVGRQQKRAPDPVDACQSASVAQPNIHNTIQAEWTSGLNREESRVGLVEGYPGYQAPRADPQTEGSGVGNWTEETGQPAQQDFDPAIYGTNPQDNFSGTPGQLSQLPVSSAGRPQADSQTISSITARGMNDFGQPQSYRASQYQHQNYREVIFIQQTYSMDLFASQDWDSSAFIPRDSVDDCGEQLTPGQLQNPESSLIQEQYDRTTYVDQDRHVWNRLDLSLYDGEYAAYTAARYSNSAGHASETNHAVMVDQNHQRVEHSFANGRTDAGKNRTSRKRRAESEFDGGLVESTRKCRNSVVFSSLLS